MSASFEARGSQQVLNCHWPAQPAMLVAREHAIPVRIRVVFEHDGECFIDGWAKRWDHSHVYASTNDPRVERQGIWLKPHDVYRRTPTAQPRNVCGRRPSD